VTIGTPIPATTRVVQIDPAPIPTFTAVHAPLNQRHRPVGRRHVAGHEVHFRKTVAHALDDIEDALRMAVGRVDHQDIDVGGDERRRAVHRVLRHANRRAAPQAAQRVLRRLRVFHRFLDILDGYEPFEPEVMIDDEQFFDLFPVEDLARLIQVRADRNGDEILVRHHVGNRAIDVGLEAQVPVRQDADEAPLFAAVLRDRHARDPVFLHQLERFMDTIGGGKRDRIDDHPALRPLHAIDL